MMQPSNEQIAEYLRDVGRVFSERGKSDVYSSESTAQLYFKAADKISKELANVADMTREQMQQIPGIGAGISETIISFLQGKEANKIAVLRNRTPRINPHLNDNLADYMESQANTPGRSENSQNAHRIASKVIRFYPMPIRSLMDTAAIKGIGPDTSKTVGSYFSQLGSSQQQSQYQPQSQSQYQPPAQPVLPPYIPQSEYRPQYQSSVQPHSQYVQEARYIPESESPTLQLPPYQQQNTPHPVAPSPNIPELSPEGRQMIGNITSEEDLYKLNLSLRDLTLLYWARHISVPPTRSDLDGIREVFRVFGKVNIEPTVESDGLTVSVLVNFSLLSENIKVCFRGEIYSDPSDTTVVFQSLPTEKAKLVRIRAA